MFLGEKYRFYMSFPGLGIVEVFPTNEFITWKYEKGSDHDSFTKELGTPLVMADHLKKGTTDFTYIYNIERSRDRCLRVPVYIDKRCDLQSPFVRYWSGFFTMQECIFDVEKCKVEVAVQVNDDIRCFLDHWEDDINLVFGAPDFTPAQEQTFGTIRTSGNCLDNEISPYSQNAFPDQVAAYTVLQDCEGSGAPADGWTVLEHRGVFIDAATSTWDVATTWIREVYASVLEPTDDNGNPWIEYSPGNWARSPLVTEIFPYAVGYVDPLFPDTWQFLIRFKLTALDGNEVQALTNGRYLNTILDHYFTEMCDGYTLVSNFFGLNVDGTQPVNDQYADAELKLHELVLHPTHDIVKTDELDASFRIEEFSLKDLILDLVDTFNLVFYWDELVNVWRLEHVTYLAAEAMLDLTTDEAKKFISGYWRYSYDKFRLPREEQFEFVTLTEDDKNRNDQDKNFDGYPINYAPSDCLNLNSTEEKRNIQIYLTDLFFVFNDHVPPAGGATIQEDSIFYGTTIFVLMSTTAGRIDTSPSCLDPTDAGLNIVLGWPCLHDKYWKQDRYLLTGEMNRVNTLFNLLRRGRTQVPISLPMCCTDFDGGFSPQDLVKTQLGWGQVTEAEYTEPSERLTITLRHD